MKPILLRGHERPINAVKINYDGDLIFTGSADAKINIWKSQNGERLGQVKCSAAVRSLDVTEDSAFFYAGLMTGIVEVFKLQGGEHIGKIEKKSFKIEHIELSMGSKFLSVVTIISPSNAGIHELRR
jgi:translation initiation factor 3 subunit I